MNHPNCSTHKNVKNFNTLFIYQLWGWWAWIRENTPWDKLGPVMGLIRLVAQRLPTSAVGHQILRYRNLPKTREAKFRLILSVQAEELTLGPGLTVLALGVS